MVGDPIFRGWKNVFVISLIIIVCFIFTGWSVYRHFYPEVPISTPMPYLLQDFLLQSPNQLLAKENISLSIEKATLTKEWIGPDFLLGNHIIAEVEKTIGSTPEKKLFQKDGGVVVMIWPRTNNIITLVWDHRYYSDLNRHTEYQNSLLRITRYIGSGFPIPQAADLYQQITSSR